MRILAVIILYHPVLEHLRKNIDAISHDVERVIIWDNSPMEEMEHNKSFCKSHYPAADFVGDGRNMGISHVLNYAWQFARSNDYDTLLTLDQDSLFVDFNTYKQRVSGKWAKDGLCLCGPTPNLHLAQHPMQGFSKQDDIITSGMLVPISLLSQCGGYCTDFKVDGIDVELCYHLREFGFLTYRDNQSNLIQQFGTPESKTIMGITFHAHNYSPSRLYGIFRNHTIIWRNYHQPYALLKKVVYGYFFKIVVLGVIMVEKQKKEKLSAVFRGFKDGFSQNICGKEK